jgi:hypothetical protein
MDASSAKIKSLEDIISLMDGHMGKSYASRLPKKAEMKIETSMEADPASESPAEMFEAQPEAAADEMDDQTMQDLMKMYEDEEGSDEPVWINGGA